MTARQATDFMARAQAAWGTPPDWILALVSACQVDSQAAVAKRLSVSGSMLSGALGRRYPGDMAKLEARVRGALMGATVACPVLGEIGRDRCIDEQAKPFSTASSVAVRLNRACKDCPNRQRKDGQ
ncbi:transcriptional regulator [Aquabacter cavernae]|uniref:transcriptional regulator n=1 Tax=Aquabacter cavernae TaxID=2496029 RepID=UPI001FE0A8B2|nr:transcriptional regulator [Aquabacter cavernae]